MAGRDRTPRVQLHGEREREREQQQQRQFVAVILSHDHYHTSGVRCTYELLAVLVSS